MAAKTTSVRNCRARNADAPSCTAWAMAFMFSVPSPAARTCERKTYAMASAASAMTPTTTTRLRLPVEMSTAASAVRAPKETRGMRILPVQGLWPLRVRAAAARVATAAGAGVTHLSDLPECIGAHGAHQPPGPGVGAAVGAGDCERAGNADPR